MESDFDRLAREKEELLLRLAKLENEELRAQVESKEARDESKGEPENTAPSAVSPSKGAPRSKKKLALMLTGAFVFAIALGVVLQLVVLPALESSPSFGKTAPLRPVNTEAVVYTGQAIPSANSEQKGLASGSKLADTPGFIFSNGDDDGKQKLDIYIDFGSQKARDFFLLNQETLQTFVEAGDYELTVKAIISGNPYSIYGPEALAEAFVLQPDLSWAFLKELLILSAQGEREGWKIEKVASEFAKKAQAIGITGIDKQSLQNGTFASWLLSIGNDPAASQGLTLPALFIDGKPVETQDVNLNDGTSLYTILRGNLNEA